MRMRMIHCHEIWPCSSHAKRPKSLCRISWPWIILMTVRRPKKKDFCFSSLACDIILTYFGPWRELKLVNNSAGVPLNFLSGPGKNAVSLTFLDQIGHRLERLLSLCGARYDQKISSLSWLQIALWGFEKNPDFVLQAADKKTLFRKHPFSTPRRLETVRLTNFFHFKDPQNRPWTCF